MSEGFVIKLLLIAPLLITAGGGILSLLEGAGQTSTNSRRASAGYLLLALFSMLFPVIFSPVFHTGQGMSLFGDMLQIDVPTIYAWGLLLFAGLMVAGFSERYHASAQVPHAESGSLMLFALFGMMLMSATTNLVMLFVGLELAAVSLYVAVGLRLQRFESIEASLKYLLPGAVGTAFFVYGIALIFCSCGTLEISAFKTLAGENFHVGLLLAGVLLMLAGLAFKLGIAPFHFWTPDVYQGAPTNITAFMAVGVKVAAFVALTRLFFALMPALDISAFKTGFGYVLLTLAILSIIVGNLAALRQTNFKRMLAFSGIAHAGYMLAGAGGAWFLKDTSGALNEAMRALLFYGSAYALMTLGAFGVIMALEKGREEGEDFNAYQGLARRNFRLTIFLAIFMLSLIGVPPLPGFWAKFYIISLCLKGGLFGTSLIIVLGSVVSIYYYMKPLARALSAELTPDAQLTQDAPHRGDVFLCGLLAIVNIIVGLVPFALLPM